MHFAFYDFETTGTSPAFDHPLQFAAILTDGEFREIERVNLRCRIAPHIIPSPWALAVTGLRPAQLTDPSLPSLFEFTQDIAALIERWSPATWTGFNSIQFDEEMLRQAFYQNLQPEIFATQINGNLRLDILTSLYAAWYRAPDLFAWPVDANGRLRFKLDLLAPLNGFVAHNAHDALGDVEATIHLARLIAQRAPGLWAEILSNRDRSAVQTRLAGFQPMALIERYGGGPPRVTIGCFCGVSDSNTNQVGFFDLDAADPADVQAADDATILAAVTASPKVIRSLAINASPALLAVPDPSPAQMQRAAIIAQAPEFRGRVARALAARFPADPEAPPAPVEQQIFGGLYSAPDKDILRRFQRADWPKRLELVAAFADPRLRDLGRRLVALHAPGLLTAEERSQFDAWRQDRWSAPNDPAIGWTGLARAQTALEELRASATVDPDLVSDIDAYLQGFAPRPNG